MINFIFILLLALALVLSLLVAGGLLLWLIYGDTNVLLPGLGLVVAFPVFVVALAVLQLAVIVSACFVSSFRPPNLS